MSTSKIGWINIEGVMHNCKIITSGKELIMDFTIFYLKNLENLYFSFSTIMFALAFFHLMLIISCPINVTFCVQKSHI